MHARNLAGQVEEYSDLQDYLSQLRLKIQCSLQAVSIPRCQSAQLRIEKPDNFFVSSGSELPYFLHYLDRLALLNHLGQVRLELVLIPTFVPRIYILWIVQTKNALQGQHGLRIFESIPVPRSYFNILKWFSPAVQRLSMLCFS